MNVSLARLKTTIETLKKLGLDVPDSLKQEFLFLAEKEVYNLRRQLGELTFFLKEEGLYRAEILGNDNS